MVRAERAFPVREHPLVLGDGVLGLAARQVGGGQPEAGGHRGGMPRALDAPPVGQRVPVRADRLGGPPAARDAAAYCSRAASVSMWSAPRTQLAGGHRLLQDGCGVLGPAARPPGPGRGLPWPRWLPDGPARTGRPSRSRWNTGTTCPPAGLPSAPRPGGWSPRGPPGGRNRARGRSPRRAHATSRRPGRSAARCPGSARPARAAGGSGRPPAARPRRPAGGRRRTLAGPRPAATAARLAATPRAARPRRPGPPGRRGRRARPRGSPPGSPG